MPWWMWNSEGTMNVASRGKEGPGEVTLHVSGISSNYIAYSDEPIARGTLVVVWNYRGGRTVDVTPINQSK